MSLGSRFFRFPLDSERKVRGVIRQVAKTTTVDFTAADDKKLVAKLAKPHTKSATVVSPGHYDRGDAVP